MDVGVVELPCSISIEPGEVYIVSLGSIDNKILEFSTENDFIEITEILQIIEQSEISGGAFSNTSSITYAFNGVDGSDYYALLHNKLDVTQTVYPKLSEISAVYVGTDGEMSTEIDCYGTNYSYICLTDVFAGSYVLNLEHETISDYIIYDESFNVLAKDSGVNSHISFTVNTESILYIGIIASTAGTYDVELGYAENAFQWVINEEPIFGNIIYLEQGEGVSAGFMINGTMIDCEIGIDNYNLQNNLYSINIENSNFITVNSNCYIGGSGCTLCVKINGTIIQNSPRLTIIPLLKYPFEGLVDISVDDSNNVIVKWQMVQNLALFRIQLSGSSKVFTIEAGGCIPGQIYEYTINESSFPTVMPILNFDIINIVYSYANEMTGNGEITSEMTYTLNYYFDCGSGTQADPYEIVNERQFKNIEKMAQSNVYYELKNNLDLGNYYMGMDVFNGTLYGNNNTITWGMRYYADDAILNTHALFIENRGRIEKLDVKVNFKTSTKNSSLFSYVGGIVGKNYGTIYYCSVSGSVIDTSVSRHILGGIAAYNASGGWIYETEVRGTFTGTYIIGGISGINDGQINSCYANCTLTLDVGSNYSAGNAAVGQIAGVNNDYIYGCTVGTDNSGYKIYLDIPSSLRPFAGSIVGAQNVSATELRNCRDMGIMVSISGLSSAQKTNVEKLSGGDIGNEFSGISWN